MIPLPIDSSPCWISCTESSVPAGFPSPAEDFGQATLNISSQLIQHPQATFYMRVRGDSMVLAGINDGDYVIVDRAVKPSPGHVVVAVVEGEFTLKYLRRRADKFFLEAANPTFPPIHPKEGAVLEVWGVATNCIHPLPGASRWR